MIHFRERHFRIFILILLLFTFLGGYSCSDQKQTEKPKVPKKMTFATVPSMVEVASHVAYHNKYFTDEGLDINLMFTSSGNLSLERLLKGEFDIATVTETPVVHKSFIRNDFYIVGDAVRPVEHQIVARKDRGIDDTSDLKGKRIAVMQGTSADYFLDSFLMYNELSRSDVEVINMLTINMPSAIEKGEVDAISCWQPFALKAQRMLGENAIILPSKNIHTVSWLIIVTKKYANENQEAIQRFLRAIIKAEKFLKANRKESIRIHADMSKVDRDIVDTLFDNMNYDLSLRHQLLLNLENLARWAIRHKYTDKQEVPNYLDYIYIDPLKKVKPRAVTIIKDQNL